MVESKCIRLSASDASVFDNNINLELYDMCLNGVDFSDDKLVNDLLNRSGVSLDLANETDIVKAKRTTTLLLNSIKNNSDSLNSLEYRYEFVNGILKECLYMKPIIEDFYLGTLKPILIEFINTGNLEVG